MKPEIKIGMTVYLRPSNYSDNTIHEGTLTNIGRRNYTVTALGNEYKFDFNGRAEGIYSPSYHLFFSKEELKLEVEYEGLLNSIYHYFESVSVFDCPLGIEQLRQITTIMNIKPESELKAFTVCYEISGGITIKAETADMAEKLFNEMPASQLFENANPAVITDVFEDTENIHVANEEEKI